MRVILAAVLALSATGASAQTNVCGWEFGKWVCRTQAPPPNIYGQGMAAYDRGVERGQQQRDAATRNQVAAYVRAGQCDAAKDLALRAGDMALADQAVRLCTPR